MLVKRTELLSAPFAHPTSTNSAISLLEDCPLRFHAWDKEFSDDPDGFFLSSMVCILVLSLFQSPTFLVSMPMNLTITLVRPAQILNRKWIVSSKRNSP